jgi:hypothetical protein
LVAALALAGLALVSPASASAAIPVGNLLKNPGAELGSASSTGNDIFEPPEWIHENFDRATQVRYGAPNFPTAAQGAALRGGRSFFAGTSRGPTDPRDLCVGCGSDRYKQTAIFPYDDTLKAVVDAGKVQYTISGCLGGNGSQGDYVFFNMVSYGETGQPTSAEETLRGPSAAERGNATALLPRARTLLVPAGTRSIFVRMGFEGGDRQHIDGYADNLALRLTPAGSTPRGPDCPPSRANRRKVDKVTDPWGTNPAAVLTRIGSKIRLKHGVALVKLHCGLLDAACRGRLTLAAGLGGARAGNSAAAQLGSARFNIPARQTKTVRVKLKRSARKRFARLSRKRLSRLAIDVTAKLGTQTTKFRLGARR